MDRMGSGSAMKEWSVTVSCELTPERVARAAELARWRWGSSARIVSSDPATGAITFVGPDRPATGPDFVRAIEADEGVPQPPGRRTRSRRSR